MTNEDELEVIDIPPKKVNMKLLIDILILGVVICAFFSGYWYGQRKEYKTSNDFWEEYVFRSCDCKYRIVESDGRRGYEYEVVPTNFSRLYGLT